MTAAVHSPAYTWAAAHRLVIALMAIVLAAVVAGAITLAMVLTSSATSATSGSTTQIQPISDCLGALPGSAC